MSRAASSADSLHGMPDVNDLVRVSVAGGDPSEGPAADSVPTRVENVVVDAALPGGRRYMIASPRYRGDSELPAPGTRCTLEWPTAQGLWILPVLFAGEEAAREGLRVWLVDTVGPAQKTERRSYVRVAWSLPVTLTTMSAAEVRMAVAGGLQGPTMVAEPTDESVPDTVTGHTSDISEGGIRMLLAAPPPPADLGVVVHLEVSGERFDLPSRVRWVRATGRANGQQFEAAVAFDDPDRHGDRLRPLLFAEQLRIRRAGLA